MSTQITANLERFATECGAVENAECPVHCLPEPIRKYCREGAQAIGVEVAYLVAAVLPVIGAAIGNSYVIQLKRGWVEPCLFWVGLVGPPCAKKSPVISAVTSFLRQVQEEWFAEYEAAMAKYRIEEKRFKIHEKIWERQQTKPGSTVDYPPLPPDIPVCQRIAVSDATPEALVPILQAARRGIVCLVDELVSWFGSLGAYKKSNGGKDEGFWLSAFRAEPVTVDRKGCEPVHVDRACIGLLGSIQPAILRQLIETKPEILGSGMLARLILVCPALPRDGWTEDEISETTLAEVERLVRSLLALDMTDDDPSRPNTIGRNRSRPGEQ